MQSKTPLSTCLVIITEYRRNIFSRLQFTRLLQCHFGHKSRILSNFLPVPEQPIHKEYTQRSSALYMQYRQIIPNKWERGLCQHTHIIIMSDDGLQTTIFASVQVDIPLYGHVANLECFSKSKRQVSNPFILHENYIINT